jgi:hypothetical protein
MGSTNDYVNIVWTRTGVKDRVLASNFRSDTMRYDIGYYSKVLDGCIQRCVIAAGIPDATAITAGYTRL